MADQRKNPFLEEVSAFTAPVKLTGIVATREDEAVVDSSLKMNRKTRRALSQVTNVTVEDKATSGATKEKLAHALREPSKSKRIIATGAIVLTVTSLISIPANAVEQDTTSYMVGENGENIVIENPNEAGSAQKLNKVGYSPVETFTTANVENETVIPMEVEAVLDEEFAAKKKAEEEARKAEEARIAAEEEARASAAAAAAAKEEPRAGGWQGAPASGSGRSDIANAAASQLGVIQDCTDLVQYALASVGINATRANGGFDFGTNTEQFSQFGGYVVDTTSYLPGDILVWPGYHVAVYFGNGQVVHGGWGSQDDTVMNSWMGDYTPYVVRF